MGPPLRIIEDRDAYSVLTVTEMPAVGNGTDVSSPALHLNCTAQDPKAKGAFSMSLVLSEEGDTVSYVGGIEFASQCLTDLEDQALENAVQDTIRRVGEFMNDAKNGDRVHIYGPDVDLDNKSIEIRKKVIADIQGFRKEFQVPLLELYSDMMATVEKKHAKPPKSPFMKRLRSRVSSWGSAKSENASPASPTRDPANDADDEGSSE